MGSYVINGGRRLNGKIKSQTAKNSVLPILAASILTDEEVVIMSCPKIQDVLNMVKILNALGVNTEFQNENLIINGSGINTYSVPSILAKELRSSIFMLGSLIARMRRAVIPYPGGCNIGTRPFDLHVSALFEMGVNITDVGNKLVCRADRLRGKELYLDFPSVGATENLMIAGVLAEGKTEIHNAAREPEIVDLMNFLNSMGAKVYGAGTSTIFIEGVKRLHGTCYKPIYDRIEIGTFLIATAICGGEVEIVGCDIKNISALVHKLCDNTCKITIKDDIIYIKSGGSGKSFSIDTGPHPSFPTDLQSQMMALATVADGTSVITENVFESRYQLVPDLISMGADITVKGRTAIINGVKKLHGSKMCAKDLRGGAALVIAALVAEGESNVYNIRHIDRGYLDFDKKLQMLGADVKRYT